MSLSILQMGDYLVTAGTLCNLRLVCQTKENVVNNIFVDSIWSCEKAISSLKTTQSDWSIKSVYLMLHLSKNYQSKGITEPSDAILKKKDQQKAIKNCI